jgi:hypothetical protein
MSLLRREPREVYRVYDEEEFLAADRVGAEHQESPAPPRAELPRQSVSMAEDASARATGVRRFAVPAVLIGAVAAVGGLVAASGMPSRRGIARRPDAGSGAAAASVTAARTSPEQTTAERAAAGRPLRNRQHVGARQPSAERAPAGRRGGRPRHPSHGALARARATLYNAALLTASSRGEGPQPVLGEFGFER